MATLWSAYVPDGLPEATPVGTRVRRAAASVVATEWYSAVLLVGTIVSVVADDIIALVAPAWVDRPLAYIVFSICVIFSIDLVLSTVAFGRRYVCSVFCWLDAVATVVLLLEVLPVFDRSDAITTGEFLVMTRLGRVAKAVTRMGKFVRFIKLFRHCMVRSVSGDLGDDPRTHPTDVGQKLKRLTIRNVIAGCLLAFCLASVIDSIRASREPPAAHELAAYALHQFSQLNGAYYEALSSTLHQFYASRTLYVRVNTTQPAPTLDFRNTEVLSADVEGTTVWLDYKDYAQMLAALNLIQAVWVVALLVAGNHLFTSNAQRLFVTPVEEMMHVLSTLRGNPMDGLDHIVEKWPHADETNYLVGALRGLLDAFQQKIQRQRELLAQAQMLQQESSQASRMKTNFVMSISHEVRTPISGVLSLTELLQSTQLSTEQAELVNSIRTCGEALLTQINDILDYGRLEHGGFKLEHTTFNLRSLVDDVFALVNYERRGKKVDVSVHLDSALPAYVVGDSYRLRQMVVNLVNNSVKFTEHGNVTVNVRLPHATELPELEGVEDTDDRWTTADRCYIYFEVVDTGIGIPEEKLPTLFEPFIQADASTTRKFGGSGLGLSICKQLAEKMKGRVGVESPPSGKRRGSRFWFVVRCDRCSEDTEETQYPLDTFSETCAILLINNHPTRHAVQHMVWAVGLECILCTSLPDLIATLRRTAEGLPSVDWEAVTRAISAPPPEQSGCLAPPTEVRSTSSEPLCVEHEEDDAAQCRCQARRQKTPPKRTYKAARILMVVDERDLPHGVDPLESIFSGQGVPACALLTSRHGKQRLRDHKPYLTVWTKPVRRQDVLKKVCRMSGTASVQLRMNRNPAVHNPQATQPKTPPAVAVGGGGPAVRFEVLVGEDNPTNQMLLERQLASLGYRAVLCENGVGVLRQLSKQFYPCILLDMHMPEMDGYEAAQEIRKRETDGAFLELPSQAGSDTQTPRSPIYIAALTAEVLPGTREKCLEVGMDEYLIKPVGLQQLRVTLEKVFKTTPAVPPPKKPRRRPPDLAMATWPTGRGDGSEASSGWRTSSETEDVVVVAAEGVAVDELLPPAQPPTPPLEPRGVAIASSLDTPTATATLFGVCSSRGSSTPPSPSAVFPTVDTTDKPDVK